MYTTPDVKNALSFADPKKEVMRSALPVLCFFYESSIYGKSVSAWPKIIPVVAGRPISMVGPNNDTKMSDKSSSNADIFSHRIKTLSQVEIHKLNSQNARLISEYKARQLEKDAQRHWDIFYKRNETNFFKDRHWTTREFVDLINFDNDKSVMLLEIGCGVGNLVYPLIEEGFNNFYFYACDFSPRAVEFVKSHKLYDENKIKAFQCDITTDDLFKHLNDSSVDIVTLIFVLSAIHPDKFVVCLTNAARVLRPGGVVLFRDYGLYDMAQLRFKPGHKIADNFYMRQDGTRSYYFSEEELAALFTIAGFQVEANSYVERRTVNVKEGVDAPRIFVQGKFRKPIPS